LSRILVLYREEGVMSFWQKLFGGKSQPQVPFSGKPAPSPSPPLQTHSGAQPPGVKEPTKGDVPMEPNVMKMNPVDGAEMVLIPGGPFIMGTGQEEVDAIVKQPNVPREIATQPGFRKSFSNQMPRRTVELAGYYMYKSMVTVAQYAVLQRYWRIHAPGPQLQPELG
jgi:formylglycine-generating enzyme required for sulfatase activity